MESTILTGRGNHHVFNLEVSETYVGTSNENYSNLSYTFYLNATSWNWEGWGNKITYTINIGDSTFTGSIPTIPKNKKYTIKSGTIENVAHSSDGTKTLNLSFSIDDNAGQSYTPGDVQASGTMNLTSIPRYGTIYQRLDSYYETIAYAIVSSDSLFDKLWYSLDNGQNYIEYTLSGASSYTNVSLYNLQSNTHYELKTKIRRQDSQLVTEATSSIPFTTYDYPKCIINPEFTIGQPLTLTLYNPLHRQVTITGMGNGNVTIFSGTTNQETITGFNTTADINNQYNSITNSPSGEYKVKVSFQSSNKESNYSSYYINENDCKPTFSNYTFEDVNSTTLALTGDSSKIINGYSTVRVTIPYADRAIGNKGATITKYKIAGKEFAYADNFTTQAGGDLPNFTGDKIIVSPTDTRGVENPVQQNVDLIAYFPISRGNFKPTRLNGVGSEVTFEFSGQFWNGNFGDEANTLTASYEYKKTTESSYHTGTSSISITTTSGSNNFSFNGRLIGDATEDFDVDSAYNVIITVSDKLSSVQFVYLVAEGSPAFDLFGNCISLGAYYDETEGGRVQIGGKQVDNIATSVSNNSIQIYNIINRIAGYGEHAKLQSGGNLNTAFGQKSGFYMSLNSSNAPTTDPWHYIIHIAHNDLFQIQYAQSFWKDVIYVRRSTDVNGVQTWGSWHPIYMGDTGDYTLETGITYRKIGNQVNLSIEKRSDIELTGFAETGIASSALPAGYRPNKNIYTPIFVHNKTNTTTATNCFAIIKTDGTITIFNWSPTFTTDTVIGQISYFC